MIFAGIDGGQSSTAAVVADERGAILGRAKAPPADLVGLARDAPQQSSVLRGLLQAALAAAGLPSDTAIAALVAGISGYDEGESRFPEISACAQTVRVVHDTVIAHAGALDGAAGIVIVAGTGSVAAGCALPGEPLVRAGGWGYVFGDEGSAFWISVGALRRAMQCSDRGERSALEGLALEHFNVPSLRAIQHGVAHGEIDRALVAGFARIVMAAAAADCAVARSCGEPSGASRIRQDAARELASLVQTLDSRLAPVPQPRPVSYAGGLFSDQGVVTAFASELQRQVPRARLQSPVHEPVVGALRLAYSAAGRAVPVLGARA